MFEIPAAKRVKRSDLLGDDIAEKQSLGSEDESAVEQQTGLASYGFEYEFIENAPPTAITASSSQKEDAFQFNLFRPAAKSSAAAPRTLQDDDGHKAIPDQSTELIIQPALITIRSPTPENLDAPVNFKLQFTRPDSYYSTAALPAAVLERLKSQYSASAVSGGIVIERSTKAWPGSSNRWRLIKLPAHSKQIVLDHTAGFAQPPNNKKLGSGTSTVSMRPVIREHSRQRPRPSKKRRDMLKQKSAHRLALIDATKSKEEHEKEKRNKKNRERKLKRRAKERREKLTNKSAGSVSDAEHSDT